MSIRVTQYIANESKDLNVPLSRRHMEGPAGRELQFFNNKPYRTTDLALNK